MNDRPSLLSDRLVPDDMVTMIMPLLPKPQVRPQGGGRGRVDDRAALAAVVYVLTAGVSWRRLLPELGVASQIAYRRHVEWSAADVWRRLLERLDMQACDDEVASWCRTVATAAIARGAR